MGIWDQAQPTTSMGTPYAGGPSASGFGQPASPTEFSRSIFFQPTSGYGAPSSWQATPLAQNMRESAPQVAYATYGNRVGIGDNDQGFNNWFYQQFPRFQRAYGQATTVNPNLRIDEFIASLPGLEGLRRQYEAQTPDQRGLSPRNFAPSARWINRG
ncbi:MAG TPA: hypothetical protein VNM48_05740 [Chloroflexota bacterium]|nr:hypothetical protein [Chloroflexota bacterium]